MHDTLTLFAGCLTAKHIFPFLCCHQVQPTSLVLIITSLSLLMQGVSEASERPGFFKRIVEANVSGIAKAYAAAETLFGQLQV
jgi:hypothetical protein